MTTGQLTPFDDLLLETRDGEWGEGEEAHGHTLCEIVRGTDFADLHDANLELPRRWISDHLVERKALRPGDILIETAGGTAKQSTGRTALLTERFFRRHREMPVLCSSFARHLRIDGTKVRPDYLYYVLQALYRAGYMAVFNLQHTGVARFQFTAFRKKTSLELASREAQPKIAAILSAYDDLIANNQRRIALLEDMAEEIYREWFVRMRFPGAKSSAPAAKQPFDELCVLSRGFDLPDSDMQPGEVPVVASTSIKGFHNVAKVQPPVVTTGRSGSLGTVLFVNQPAWPLNTALYVKNFKGNSPHVVYFTLKSLHLENFNAGAGVPTLNRNHLAGIRVFVPPKSVQREFDGRVGPVLAMAEQLQKANQLLANQRDALLPRLISGKLKVDHLDLRLPSSMRAEAEAVA